MKIAQHFSAGKAMIFFLVRETDGWTRNVLEQTVTPSFNRPLHGLASIRDASPALKCWAITSRPLIADCKATTIH